MKQLRTIDINKQENVKLLMFPDSQPHVNVQNICAGDEVSVRCSILDTSLLISLLEVSNAIDHLFAVKEELHIPYLMGARSDRVMLPGDSVDIQVIAELINSMNFKKVYLYDVHSDVSKMLIKNSINISNRKLVEQYNELDAVLICPDAGAAKKVSSYLEWCPSIKEVVHCVKERNLESGDINLKVLEPEKCFLQNCVIIDDICDGGGTFLAIAQQIKPYHLTLIVTHGIFSRGFGELDKHFKRIITSDSRPNSHKTLTTINL